MTVAALNAYFLHCLAEHSILAIDPARRQFCVTFELANHLAYSLSSCGSTARIVFNTFSIVIPLGLSNNYFSFAHTLVTLFRIYKV